MLNDFYPGDFVLADRPAGRYHVPDSQIGKVGIVIAQVPPGAMGNGLKITQLLVAWSCPDSCQFLTLEPDHRLSFVGRAWY